MQNLVRAARYLVWRLKTETENSDVDNYEFYLHQYPEKIGIELNYENKEGEVIPVSKQISLQDPYEYKDWLEAVVIDFMDYVIDDNRIEDPFQIEDAKFVYGDNEQSLYSLPVDFEKGCFTQEKSDETSSDGESASSEEPPINIGKMAAAIRGANPDKRFTGNTIPAIFFENEVSILRALGYQVGESSHFNSELQRQTFLDDFVDAELPSNLPQSYRDSWGEPDTDERVNKMINHINGIASLFSRRERSESYAQAILEWRGDAEYLEQYTE